MRIVNTAASTKSKPLAPTVGTATDVGSGRTFASGGRADVTFTAPTFNGKMPITSYTVRAYNSANVYQGFTASGASSPISVTGMTPGTQYKYTVLATNAIGAGTESDYTSLVTATTAPQTPTITSVTRVSNTQVSIAFTGATGGSAITAITATSSPSISLSTSGTSSPVTVTGTFVQGTSYTFTITATNANGTSASSNTSGAVTPFPAPVLGAWSSTTAYPTNTDKRTGTGALSGSAVWVGTYLSGFQLVKTAYYWNGSAWTQNDYAANIGYTGIGRVSASQMLMAGGYNNLDTGTSQSAIYYGTGSSAFTAGSSLPAATAGLGIAKVSDGILFVGGDNTAQGVRYSTTVGGTLTNRGNVFPTNQADYTMGAEMNLSTAYFAGQNFTAVYSIGSVTGSFTNVATQPETTGQPNFNIIFHNINDSRIIYSRNTSSTTTTYLFNGSTFSASSSLPVTGGNWAGGARGAVMSLVSGTAHYVATLS